MRYLLFFLFTLHLSAIEVKDQIPLSILSQKEVKTKKLRLDNGLEAYLISDPLIEESACAISVEVGSRNDPKEHLGMAHFLEHMLFLGTKKYPKESGYQKFIEEHGGFTNAYTSNDRTVYGFSVDSNFFEEAIDRFSQFFVEPLFNPSGLEREMQAVDQEHQKNLEDDSRRLYAIKKSIGNPNHPSNQFATGSYETLKEVSREKIIDFYNQHYSADVMHLVIYSNLPIDQIKEFVEEKFSLIEKKKRSRSIKAFQQSLYQKDHLAKMIFYVPVKEERSLIMNWELPSSLLNHIDERPESVVSFILGHEGSTSLLNQLKKEKLAEELAAGSYYLGKNNLIFSIQISLTPKGVKDKDIVVDRVYQAIRELQQTEVSQELFKEIQTIDTLDYQYQERTRAFDKVLALAGSMIDEELETFPIKLSIIQNFAPDKVQKIALSLQEENCLYSLKAPLKELKQLLRDNKQVKWQQEKWFGGKYLVQTISKEQIERFQTLKKHPNISIPEPNPFIPKNFQLLEAKEKEPVVKTPDLIVDDDFAKVYYAQDIGYNVPEVSLHLTIRSELLDQKTAINSVLKDLYLLAIDEELNDLSYTAAMAGLNYNLSKNDRGIVLTLQGYNDTTDKLFLKLTERVKAFSLSKEHFELYLKRMKRVYENGLKQAPYLLSFSLFNDLLDQSFHSNTEKLKALKEINYQIFNNFSSQLFAKSYLEGIVVGNLNKKKAQEYIKVFHTLIQKRPYPKKEQKQNELLALIDGPLYVEKRVQPKGACTLLTLYHGSYDFKIRAMQQILSRAISTPFYSELRTKQQTGYIVSSFSRELKKELFSMFLVQSASHAPRDLLSRFELFLEQFLETNIAKKNFETIKDSLISQLKEPPKTVHEMAKTLDLLGFKFEGDFAFIKKRIQALQDVDYQEFLDFTQQALSDKNRKRLAILLQGKNPSSLTYKKIGVETLKKKITREDKQSSSL